MASEGIPAVVLPRELVTGGDPDVVAAHQGALLAVAVDRALAQHPVYADSFRAAGVAPGDVSRLEDLERLPVTTKDDFVRDPEAYRLRPDESAPGDYVVWDVTFTAGTSSGRPTPSYQTTYDFRGVLFAQRRMAEIRGFRPDDTVLNLYPLGPFPHGGWIRPTQAAAVAGVAVTVGMTGSARDDFGVTRRAREILELPGARASSILWGVPSYLHRFLEEAAEDGVRLPRLRMLAVSGEPCRPRLRRGLEELGAAVSGQEVVVSDSLGATELAFSLVECREGSGFHNPAPELAHIGVVDDAGRHLHDGGRGRLMYTHLNRRGTVLMRYLVGDIAELDTAACRWCGWAGGTVRRLHGREGSFLKVRGMMVNINALFETLDDVQEVRDYRIEISDLADRIGMDQLEVQIVGDEAGGETAPRVVERVRAATGVTPTVRFVTSDELWTPEDRMKPVRLRDLRGADE